MDKAKDPDTTTIYMFWIREDGMYETRGTMVNVRFDSCEFFHAIDNEALVPEICKKK